MIGRWTAKEPLSFAASINFYTYCYNDPINELDPTGLISLNDVRDFSASVSSSLSFGLSDYVLDMFGKYGYYNPCSDASKYGNWAGIAIGLAAGGKGFWNLGKSLFTKGGIIGPLKNWIRIGKTWDKAGNPTFGMRWGAGKLKYLKQIGNETMKELNKSLRNWKGGHWHWWSR